MAESCWRGRAAVQDFTAAEVGVYSGTASFAAVLGYQPPPDLPTVDTADFVDANVKQEFVAAADG